ncbi:MAG TPA: replication initiator [Segeticoccus sp.]|uniref:replication initiator n=1 Tax=Segeticoccus sp. TaxID=2706531 RepID=UPI002D7EFFDC|nr:replication initiator [Segeticoccus sp.]HET8601329.1 replication initiator [Segeticoccus sp.]
MPGGASWRLRFGTQLDARPVHRTTGEGELSGAIDPEAVAGYIAKYATKSAGDLEPGDAHGNEHLERLRLRVKELHFKNRSYAAVGDTSGPYALLGKWAHMLGFRGHFASKSRRYSTTMRDLRAARKRFQRLRKLNPSGVVDVSAIDPQQDDEETTLVINDWAFAGMGWLTSGDAALADAAAARAREYAVRQRANSK